METKGGVSSEIKGLVVQMQRKEPRKILFIISRLMKMAGSEKNLFEIVLNLDKSKWTPYVWTLIGGPLSEEMKRHGVEVEVRKVGKVFSIECLKLGWELIRFIRKKRIDLVVTYHTDSDIIGGIFGRIAGVPIIISNRRDMGFYLGRKHVWFYRIFGMLFDCFICVSEAVKNEIMKREWVSAEKIDVIYNGVRPVPPANGEDLVVLRRKFNIDPKKIVIGVVGRFEPIKGQILVVDAIHRLIKTYPDLVCLFVGYTDSNYFQEVKRRIGDQNLGQHFIFTGHQEEIYPFLHCMDIFVNPSLSEGFSNAILEAMSMGIPTVASYVGGNGEAIQHEQSGLLFKSGDSCSLVSQLERLIIDPELRKKLGAEGKKRVEELFQLEEMLRQNEELFRYNLIKPKLTDQIKLKFEKFISYRLKKVIKICNCYLLHYSGFVKVWETLRKKRLVVLAYHSINRITLKPLEIEQDPDNFKKQMAYLKTNYHILSLEEFLDCQKNGGRVSRDSVLITFDDGYKDFYTYAYPTLKELGIPVIVFITTDAIETGDCLFFDALRFSIMNTKRKTLDLRDFLGKEYALWPNELHLSRVIKEIVSLSKRLSTDERLKMKEAIYKRLDVNKDLFETNGIYLSWKEMLEMAGDGVVFGGHTKSHACLRFSSEKEIYNEVFESKKVLEEKTGKKVESFAYPFGGLNDYSPVSEKILRENGFKCAFVLGEAKRDDFLIGRKVVDSHMTESWRGKFSSVLFDCEITLR